jgi:hypothetical protein
MIAALYVQRGGVYYGLPDVDPWDEERDARLYAGPWPVVAHPPCARWCKLAGLVEHRYGIRRFEDGGCFEAALWAVRRFGGVLEHPAYTHAWKHFGLARPPEQGWAMDVSGGWSAHIEQGAYGHRAPKQTWLYACGVDLPSLKWGASSARARLNSWYDGSVRRTTVEYLDSKGARSATPPAFRDLLLDMARSCLQPVDT